MEKRYVYGTHTKKWYLVGEDDRDFDRGIFQEEFKELGEEKARELYLSDSLI